MLGQVGLGGDLALAGGIRPGRALEPPPLGRAGRRRRTAGTFRGGASDLDDPHAVAPDRDDADWRRLLERQEERHEVGGRLQHHLLLHAGRAGRLVRRAPLQRDEERPPTARAGGVGERGEPDPQGDLALGRLVSRLEVDVDVDRQDPSASFRRASCARVARAVGLGAASITVPPPMSRAQPEPGGARRHPGRAHRAFGEPRTAPRVAGSPQGPVAESRMRALPR